MKTFKFYLVAGLMTLSTSAFAQFANTGNNGGGNSTVDTENYSRIEVSYNPVSVSYDYEGAEDLDMTGFSFGYVKGFSVSKSLPLFVEAGLNLNYAFKSEDKTEDEITMKNKTTALAAGIPVSLAYKYTLNNSEISIVPYLGVDFKFNIIGKNKVEYDGPEEYKDYLPDNAEIDYFDKKDVEDKDSRWKRFQMGWHIGAGVNYKALYVGLKYGSDFTELCKKTKTSNWAITVGYNF